MRAPIPVSAKAGAPRRVPRDQTQQGGGASRAPDPKLQSQPSAETQQALERKQLESLMEELRKAVDKSQALKPYKDQLLLDITPEGVRVQIVDAQNRPMFDVGSARLRDYTTAILHELAPYLDSVPNRISLTGHTYPSTNGYTNWELSADRANAARRALTAGGLPDGKVSRVVGLSSSVLFDKSDPQSPINRRISIVVMTKKAEEAALKTDVAADSSNTDRDSAPDKPAATDMQIPTSTAKDSTASAAPAG
jgi:chemotaxis protein MotB